VKELESSLMMEKEQNMTTRRELSEAHQRVEELLRQIADANGTSTELQTAVQRSLWFSKKYKICHTLI
jgi:myosin-5